MHAALSDLSPQDLLLDVEQVIASAASESVGSLCFDIDGVPYRVYAETADTPRVHITATLGYMPFTVEAADKRDALMSILSATRSLPSVRFGVDRENKIVATGAFKASSNVSPEYIFHPLAIFQQEAKPFIDVIGRYL